MRQENIHRVVLNNTDIQKAKIGQGLRLDIPAGTVEILIKVEGPLKLGGNGNGNGHENTELLAKAASEKN